MGKMLTYQHFLSLAGISLYFCAKDKIKNMYDICHVGIYTDNHTDKNILIRALTENRISGLGVVLSADNIVLFSKLTIEQMIDEEIRHDRFVIPPHEGTTLQYMSSGQQRKALLNYLLSLNPECMILDDVYANIDVETQHFIAQKLQKLSEKMLMIQIFSRKRDLLPFVDRVVLPDTTSTGIKATLSRSEFLNTDTFVSDKRTFCLPKGYEPQRAFPDKLIEIKNVSVDYGENAVLRNINWTICKEEFWQLKGPNGSGKSTLVTMLTGDNPKAYGQDIYLFGRRKGSGESIWDIKKQIGYFTPSMIQRFTRDDSVENMIVSGFNDSVGLYVESTDLQHDIARSWVDMLGSDFRKRSFQNLHPGQQRMVMTARAMVKHPPLLILDEPIIDLDDYNSQLFIEMVNAIAAEKRMAIIYISHRDEENLKPEKVFELIPAHEGFTGRISE